MIFDDEGLDFSGPAMGYEPARRFGQHEDKEHLHQSRGNLHVRGNAPRPVCVDTKYAKCCPRSECSTKVPRDLIEGCRDTATSRICKLANDQARIRVRKDKAEAEDEAHREKYADYLSKSLGQYRHQLCCAMFLQGIVHTHD